MHTVLREAGRGLDEWGRVCKNTAFPDRGITVGSRERESWRTDRDEDHTPRAAFPGRLAMSASPLLP